MKEVWIINHYSQEPGHAGGTRHFALARHLVPFGWHASLIAASVELNTGRQRLRAGERRRLDEIESVPFLWVRTPQYKGNGLGRMLNMLAFSWRAWWPSTTRALPRPDVIVGSSVHPFAALAAARLARRFGVPFLFEVRDLWPQTLIDLGRITESGFTARMMRWMEGLLYRQAAATIVLLPRAGEYIGRFGIPRERIVWIPNGVDLGTFDAEPPRKTGDPFTLMYFGAHGEANGLDNVLRALALAIGAKGGARLRLRLIGDGPLKLGLQALAAKLGLGEHVSFEAPVPKSTIPGLAAQADAFVFNLVDAPVFRYGISSNKLFDFLAAARPVIFCCDASNNPVEDAGAGISVPPGRPEALAEAIRRMAALPLAERARMGAAGRRYVEIDHGFGHLAERLAQVMDQVACDASRQSASMGQT
jgi:glycosyltransferase involved in cell wall biosynthesis